MCFFCFEKKFLQGKQGALFDDETGLAMECERELYERRPPSEDDYETVRVSKNTVFEFQCLINTNGLKVLCTEQHKFTILDEG